MFKEETLSSKKIAKFKNFTTPKYTSSGFFCHPHFALKEF